MHYSQNFKEKIGEPVSGGKVLTGTLNKLGESMNDSQITKKWDIQPISIPDFFATVNNLIETDEMKKEYGYIFYVKSTDGCTFTVNVYWYDKQWLFNCFEFGEFNKWFLGRYVFSPANGTETLEPLNPSILDSYCNCKRCEHCGKIIK